MFCNAARINVMQQLTTGRPWLHLSRSARMTSIKKLYHMEFKRYLCLAQKQDFPLLNVQKINGNMSQQCYHWEGKNGSNSYTNHSILLLGMILGTAAIGVMTVLCEKEDKNPKEISELDDVLELDRKTMRNINLDLENAVDLQDAIKKTQKILKRKMEVSGAPGLVAAVSVDGKTVWEDGFGFADVENSVRCSPRTVMRIASISKSMTMTALAKLLEEGKLDLDAPVQKYVPYFPIKTFEGKEVTITTRHLLSHKSGIRHYALKNNKKVDDDKNGKDERNKNEGNKKDEQEKNEGNSKDEKENETTSESKGTKESLNKPLSPKEKKESIKKLLKRTKKKKKSESEDEFDMKEYYIQEEFDTIEEAVELFKDDELFFKPGTGFLYTTHGWTLVSAVMEGASGKTFKRLVRELIHDLGLQHTYLDYPSPIIYNRACYYVRDKHGKLLNAPYVHNSYKWAGGGFLSTVQDLTKFGNAMLYSSQRDFAVQNEIEDTLLPSYLKASTMETIWTPVAGTDKGADLDCGYGQGWDTVKDKVNYGFCRETRPYAAHTGGAVGASSVLLILPAEGKLHDFKEIPPKGIVVTIITNMQGVGLSRDALHIAKLFASVKKEE